MAGAGLFVVLQPHPTPVAAIRKPFFTSQQSHRVLPRKTHTGLFAKPAAAVKRADDINAGRTLTNHKHSEFYAVRPLDGGEEQATKDRGPQNPYLISTQILRKNRFCKSSMKAR